MRFSPIGQYHEKWEDLNKLKTLAIIVKHKKKLFSGVSVRYSGSVPVYSCVFHVFVAMHTVPEPDHEIME